MNTLRTMIIVNFGVTEEKYSKWRKEIKKKTRNISNFSTLKK